MTENKILGEEKISKLLFRFSLPCVTGLLISAFYNIVDQIFIGNSTLGYLGNAATGISFPIICIANAFAWCVGDGAAAFLSICSGRKDSDSAHKCVGTGLSATIIISVVLSGICLAFQRPLMTLFGASDATLSLAVDYFRIIALFFPIYLMINVMNSMIRADGSPNYAMIAMSVGAVLNIILDPIFIFWLNWGIQGAAIATVIGQTASFVVCVVYFRKPKSFHLTKESFRIDWDVLWTLIQMGGSTFITQISIVVMSLMSNMTLFRYGALSVYGSDIPISVFSIQTKVYTIVNNIVVGIALGGQPILGYNYGAKKMDRVREAYRLILISCLSVGVIATLVFELCPELLIHIFGSGNALYMDFAVKTFRIYLSMSVITCLTKLTSVFFQAIGKSVQAMITSIIRDIVCFVSLTLVLCRVLEAQKPGSGIFGILLAAPLSDIVAGMVVVALTVSFFRSLKNETEAPAAQPVLQPSHPGTVVTIARQHGSCGKQIGKLVAEKLGVPFYYKEMAALAAQESGLAGQFISDMNQNSPAVFRQLYLSTNVIQQAVIAQEQIIQQIADQGACVIVGRAADHVLRSCDNVVRVFLYAPEETRIQNIMAMYGDNHEDARAHMQRADDARASYYRGVSGKEWSDVRNYDLCIDTSIGKEQVAALIADYVQQRTAQTAVAQK